MVVVMVVAEKNGTGKKAAGVPWINNCFLAGPSEPMF
jgi:hypothetical protein